MMTSFMVAYTIFLIVSAKPAGVTALKERYFGSKISIEGLYG